MRPLRSANVSLRDTCGLDPGAQSALLVASQYSADDLDTQRRAIVKAGREGESGLKLSICSGGLWPRRLRFSGGVTVSR